MHPCVMCLLQYFKVCHKFKITMPSARNDDKSICFYLWTFTVNNHPNLNLRPIKGEEIYLISVPSVFSVLTILYFR